MIRTKVRRVFDDALGYIPNTRPRATSCPTTGDARPIMFDAAASGYRQHRPERTDKRSRPHRMRQSPLNDLRDADGARTYTMELIEKPYVSAAQQLHLTSACVLATQFRQVSTAGSASSRASGISLPQ